MLASPATVSELLELGPRVPVLVEHGRCGRPLGKHVIYRERDEDVAVLEKSADALRAYNVAPGPGHRGPETTPGLRLDTVPGDWKPGLNGWPQVYERVFCVCLPPGHVEKIKVGKIGSLPVSFPTRKWGRAIDLPVVTI